MKKRLDAPLELKDIDEKGAFTGYGSVFGNLDSYKDVIEKGAFKSSLDKWRKKGRMPAMLWQHDPSQPIGAYKTMREDTNGLYVEGQLAMSTVKGREAYELMQMDALGGMSIGFMTKGESFDHETGVRTLKELDLFEVSLVTFPANEEAKIASVKDALQYGELPSKRELELFLRDAGFSRLQAKQLISGGYESLSRRDAGADDSENEAVNSLKSLIAQLEKR